MFQHEHVDSMPKKFGMESYPVHTPGVPNQLVVDDASEDTFLELSEKTNFQATVGSLVFLSTKFDIAFRVSQVARHMSRPSSQHLIVSNGYFGT